MNRLFLLVLLAIAAPAETLAVALPPSDERPAIKLPDFGAELRAFDTPYRQPVAWWPHVVNAAWGGGRGGPERNGGWLDKYWELVDCLDRSSDYSTHEYLTHRGIWYEVYGSNEYQETIHFHEDGAKKLLWDNGIARDPAGERVLSEDYNMKVKWWADRIGWNAYITCNNAPRWWAVIDYDWLTSPLLGFSVSQDNIGGPLSRIGAGGHGRYCNFCNSKFFHYLTLTGRLPEFRNRYKHIRDYVRDNLADVLRQLPPSVKHRWNAAEAQLLWQMCAPPVMSEYQKFLYLSHLHNFVRYYRDVKLSADRLGRPYDVHGNQGGSFIGPDPYQVALADFVDTVWFESAGISAYDMFKNGWNNSGGAFRYQMGQAMTGGRRPFMSMTAFHKHTPDLVEHEMAEQCAGGGVLFVNQEQFATEPELLTKFTDYCRLRHAHRDLYANPGRKPYAQAAVVYSIPTLMYRSYQYAGDAPPLNNLSGIARAMEEGHVPLDVVIFNHPEIHADHTALDDLRRYRLVILPALECLSDSQIEMLTRYVQSGGTLGLIGPCGARNEDNLPRQNSPVDAWRKAGRVVDILPGQNFLPVRAKESARTRELTQTAVAAVRGALGPGPILDGQLPPRLWVKCWAHGCDLASFHFVNYDIDFAAGKARPSGPTTITVTLPRDIPAEEAAWLTPDGKCRALPFSPAGPKQVRVTIPAVQVYGVLMIGRKGLDSVRSSILQAQALHARAAMASGGDWGSLKSQADAVDAMAGQALSKKLSADQASRYVQLAGELLHAAGREGDRKYLARLREAALAEGAVVSLAFGARQTASPWQAVTAKSDYTARQKFGWLPAGDDSQPTPEETCYAMAQKHGGPIVREVTAGNLLFWPYKEPAPLALRTHLACGSPRRFRVDFPPGNYRVRVVTTGPSWTNRNFLVSGMVSLDGSVRLPDAVHDRGTLVAREFDAATRDGKLEFEFGGATGWGIAAMVIRSCGSPTTDPQVVGGLRDWRISPRYANPDWYPIAETSYSPEKRLASLPDPGWTCVSASPGGWPVIDLGTNRQANTGDTVYAVATIDSAAAVAAQLHFSATSAAQLWLNGEPLAYVPNEKGIRSDELVIAARLKPGKNLLVVKLQRFWERRWLFYASLTGPAGHGP